MKSEDFQKLKKGQIFVWKFGYCRSDRLIAIITDVDYQCEVCSLIVCELAWSQVNRWWKPKSVFTKMHQNKSRYATEKWFDGWENQSSKLALLLEGGRTAESFIREGIHTLIRSHTETLHNLRVRIGTEKKELYKGIRALKS